MTIATKQRFIRGCRIEIDSPQGQQVIQRLNEMPQRHRNNYLKAMRGRSTRAAIKAFCAMCVGYENAAERIRNCADMACPLYPYRPYKG